MARDLVFSVFDMVFVVHYTVSWVLEFRALGVQAFQDGFIWFA